MRTNLERDANGPAAARSASVTPRGRGVCRSGVLGKGSTVDDGACHEIQRHSAGRCGAVSAECATGKKSVWE